MMGAIDDAPETTAPSSYRVALRQYDGPLDLLLYLVKRREVDVVDLPLADLVKDYLRHLEVLVVLNLDEIGEFIVLAATLIELKSGLLIPGDAESESSADRESEASADEPTTRRRLVQQLQEYKRFKEVGRRLAERASDRQARFGRLADDLPPEEVDPARQPIRDLELWDLVSAFGRVLRQNLVPVTHDVQIDQTPITVTMQRLEALVLEAGRLTFEELVGPSNSRGRLIGKFLAVLELVKSGRIWVELEPSTDPTMEGETVVLYHPDRRPTVRRDAPRFEGLDATIAADAIADLIAMPDDQEPPPGAAPLEIERAPAENDDDFLDRLDGDGWTEADDEQSRPRASAWDDFEPLVDDE
ncbi:MAG: segregation and condensation protein A [Planctomycetia bacterium]